MPQRAEVKAETMTNEHDQTATPTPEAETGADTHPAPDAQHGVGDPVASLEAEKLALKDQLLRTLAEMDNLRKRTERQLADERNYGIEKFARDMLSVADNLGRALTALDTEARAGLSEAGQNLLAGVEMIEKDLHGAMTRHGVEVIDAAPGAVFDPNKHQAVAQIPSDQPSGKIASTFQTGYALKGRTLRAAMVAVSAGPPKA
jgi:molecular chaperone GrpE